MNIDWKPISQEVFRISAEEFIKGKNRYLQRAAARLDHYGITTPLLKAYLRDADDYWQQIKHQALGGTVVIPEKPEEAFERRTIEQRLRDRIQFLDQELRVAARERSIVDGLSEIATATAQLLPKPPPLWTPEKLSKHAVVETVYQMLSDLHAYEYVSAERTRGHNEYTAEVMARRMGSLVAAHLSIIEKLLLGGYVFPELVIGLLGDNVSGTIHDLERHSDAPNIVLSVYGCAWLLAQSISELARHYEKVYVYGVGGNHGRLPDVRRKQMKDPTRTWDYMIYLLLREMLRENNHIEFWFPDSWGAQVNIRGWNVLVGHGDDVKSWAGIPWYGLERKVGRLAALEGARGNTINYHLMGHFHSATVIPHPAGETIVNGSVIGATEFGIDSIGRADVPSQWLLHFHEEWGINDMRKLKLEPPRKKAPRFTIEPWRAVQKLESQTSDRSGWNIGT